MEYASSPAASSFLTLTRNPVLRAAGSLRFAAVLLMVWLVGMACATVYESTSGTDQALAFFYTACWFKAILALIGVNVLASLVVRYPFSRRQTGFVLTHLGILITLAGAWVTDRYSVNGSIFFAEGKTVEYFTLRGVPALTLIHGQRRASVDLTAPAFARFQEVEQPEAPLLSLDDLNVQVERFVPDSKWVPRVLDDHPRPRPAVEVSLSATGEQQPVWLFPDTPTDVGPLTATFLTVDSDEELHRLLAPAPTTQPTSPGGVKVEYGGSVFEIPLQ